MQYIDVLQETRELHLLQENIQLIKYLDIKYQ